MARWFAPLPDLARCPERSHQDFWISITAAADFHISRFTYRESLSPHCRNTAWIARMAVLGLAFLLTQSRTGMDIAKLKFQRAASVECGRPRQRTQ
jgi:hypothetical protein